MLCSHSWQCGQLEFGTELDSDKKIMKYFEGLKQFRNAKMQQVTLKMMKWCIYCPQSQNSVPIKDFLGVGTQSKNG